MSLIITVHTGEGIVMASDSRMTMSTTKTSGATTTVNVGAHMADSSFKTFLTPGGVGISTCGDASIKNMPIAGYLESFINQHANDDVDIIKDSLNAYFLAIEPNIDTDFLVAGYLDDGSGNKVQTIYKLCTKGDVKTKIDTTSQGAVWDGETDVLSRLITTMYVKKPDGSYTAYADYRIPFNFFTLQDSIDFAKFALQTTIDAMRFENRAKTVGGPIDILVIKPNNAFWIDRKELHK